MKKRASDKSIMSQNKYLHRFFHLYIPNAKLTISHAPNKKGKEILFRDMKKLRVDHQDKDPFGDKDFPFAFVIEGTTRNFFLGCATRPEREMWMNGFKVLFEYREKSV